VDKTKKQIIFKQLKDVEENDSAVEKRVLHCGKKRVRAFIPI
jgi:hypothetical protein